MLTAAEQQDLLIPLVFISDGQNPSPGANERYSVFSNQGVPLTIIQGTDRSNSNSTSSFITAYNNYAGNDAPVAINAVLTKSEGTYSISGNVDIESDIDNNQVKIFYVLTRNYNDEANHNFNHQVIGYESEYLSVSTSGQSQELNHSFTYDASVDPETIEAIVIVERWAGPGTSNREVLNVAKCGKSVVSTTALTYGQCYIGQSVTKTFSVTNISDDMSHINVNFEAEGFIYSGNDSFDLIPGQTVESDVIFTPTAAQDYTGTITITSEIAGFENNTITLNGTGFINHAPTIENLKITGHLIRSSPLNVSYDFVDEDNDEEGTHTVNWYSSTDNENWTLYDNQSGDSFLLYVAESNIGQYFKIEITPLDEHSMPGTMVSAQTSNPITDFLPPKNVRSGGLDGSNLTVVWNKPDMVIMRNFVGYIIYFNDTSVKNVMDFDTTSAVVDISSIEDLEDGTYSVTIKSLCQGGLSESSETSFDVIIENGNITANENNVENVVALGNNPNPFSPYTNISYSVKKSSDVEISIYNMKGQRVNTLVDGNINSGNHTVKWNGTNTQGQKCSAGIYFYRIKTDNKVISKKMILMK